MTKLQHTVQAALCLLAAVCVFSSCTVACSAAQNHVIAQDVLTASEILCVLASSLTNEADIAQACAIDSALVPLIRPFLLQKETPVAKSLRCQPTRDAGTDAR